MRELTISVGQSRQSTRWDKTILSWPALCERLRTPVRGLEPLAAYLKMTKAQQGERKDVGGFVAGSLNGPSRKRQAVVSRDIVTLDLDAIPAGGTETVLSRVDALGFAYCIYSTRKHRPEAPRLRVLLPLDVPVEPEAFEAISRKLAEHIGLEFCDRTTFEPHRLMYWPSVCSDGEYVYRTGGADPVPSEEILGQYYDWRNRAAWPLVPGEDNAKPKGTLKDPRLRDDVIGAFCRQYSITEAITELIPESYSTVDDTGKRWTFTGGSTYGGALVYDDLFLFSHHSTDPCADRSVNAFDLVRLHKFGGMDEEAKPDTPVNKLPSYIAMLEFARGIPEVLQDVNIRNGERALEQMATNTTHTKALAEWMGANEGEPLQESTLAELLSLLGIETHKNVITDRVEVTGCPDEWPAYMAEELLPTMLQDYLRRAGVYNSGKADICDRLEVIAVSRPHNPVRDMLEAEPWDCEDRLPTLFRWWGLDDPLSQTLVHKWLIQCVALANNDRGVPVCADGVLVLLGAQGIGKTTALRTLVPIPDMFKDGALLDPNNTDTKMQSLTCWICELGELDRTTKKDAAGLKAFLTSPFSEYRTPYARKAVRRPRMTSFCGSVNVQDFLADETGNRRFWTVPVERIDIDALLATPAEWFAQLWRQVWNEWRADPDAYHLTAQEQTELDRRNVKSTKRMDYEEELLELFNWDLPVEQWGEFTATQICIKLAAVVPGVSKAGAKRLGCALAKIEREHDGIQARMLHGRKLYLLPLPD